MGINSNVKKSDELKTQEINELAVYLNSLDPADKEERDFAFEKLWLAVKRFVISILKSRYPTYYTKHFEEMLDCAALDIFLDFLSMILIKAHSQLTSAESLLMLDKSL